MPTSPSTSRSSRRSLLRDESAVSEAVGYAITFGILSVVLVASLTAFNQAQEDAEQRVVALQAGSAAQRVAGAVVEVAVLAEGGRLQEYQRTIVLPEQFEGRDYAISLDPGQDAVVVTAQGLPEPVSEPLFGALVAQSIDICPGTDPVPGGPMRVTYDGGTVCIEEVS